jgi:hypothetical protein
MGSGLICAVGRKGVSGREKVKVKVRWTVSENV